FIACILCDRVDLSREAAAPSFPGSCCQSYFTLSFFWHQRILLPHNRSRKRLSGKFYAHSTFSISDRFLVSDAEPCGRRAAGNAAGRIMAGELSQYNAGAGVFALRCAALVEGS